MRKQLLVLAALSSALLLAACGPLTGPPPSDSGSPSVATSETPTAEITSTDAPSGPPAPAGATVVGTCTIGTSYHAIPAIYVAFSDDSTTPFTMSYTVFNADGTVPVVTETVTGPVVTRISYPCVDESSNQTWTLTVTVDGTRGGCTSSFGGQILDSDSNGDGGLGSFTSDCSGNPGV